MNAFAMIREAFFRHYGERVEAEVISPDKIPDLPNFAETLRPRAAGSEFWSGTGVTTPAG